MVAHGAGLLCVSNYVWVTKIWAFEGWLQFHYISNLGCPRMRIYCKFSFTTATDFLTSLEFPHGGNTMTKKLNPDCLQLQQWGNHILILFWIAAGLHHWQYLHRNTSLLRCKKILLAHHSLRFGPTARIFWSQNFHFLTPHMFDKQSWKSTLNASWTTTLLIYYACVSSTLVLFVLNTLQRKLCTACQGLMSFPPGGKKCILLYQESVKLIC